MPWIPPLLEIAFTVWQSQPKNTIKQAAEVSWVDHSIHIILSDSIWSYLILSDPLSDPIGSKCKTKVFKDIASFGLISFKVDCRTAPTSITIKKNLPSRNRRNRRVPVLHHLTTVLIDKKIILVLKASYLSDIHNFVWSIPFPIRFLKLSALTLMPGTFDKSSVSLLGWSFWAILIEIPFSSAAVRKVNEL